MANGFWGSQFDGLTGMTFPNTKVESFEHDLFFPTNSSSPKVQFGRSLGE